MMRQSSTLSDLMLYSVNHTPSRYAWNSRSPKRRFTDYLKDLLLSDITARQLDFSSSFYLIATTDQRKTINSFILYFDTFFTVTGHPVSSETEAKIIKEGDVILAEVWPVGGKAAPQRRRSQSKPKENVTSFSTGPQSTPTHWKQTLFMLREPLVVSDGLFVFIVCLFRLFTSTLKLLGTVVNGTFHCRKSQTNSRELEVEIHYYVKQDTDSQASEIIIQMYKVR